ncbi:MAG: hypothetical protein FWF15_11410, partial [Oscillospiraceae bacterium]|nr:hypothetical protein [Oscillospiraceae bacterium]
MARFKFPSFEGRVVLTFTYLIILNCATKNIEKHTSLFISRSIPCLAEATTVYTALTNGQSRYSKIV